MVLGGGSTVAKQIKLFLAIAVLAVFLAPPVRGLADPAAVVAAAKQSVVYIDHRDSAGRHSAGTGFFVTGYGLVLTCYHVVEPLKEGEWLGKGGAANADKVWVRLPDGKSLEAERVYADPAMDAALLWVRGTDFAPLRLATSAPAQAAEVLVMGYPLGDELGKEVVVTKGIVSSLRLSGGVLQIDAAVNPGNSGGPVLDSQGRVVGMAWARIKGVEGMNFALGIAALPPACTAIIASAGSGSGTLHVRMSRQQVQDLALHLADWFRQAEATLRKHQDCSGWRGTADELRGKRTSLEFYAKIAGGAVQLAELLSRQPDSLGVVYKLCSDCDSVSDALVELSGDLRAQALPSSASDVSARIREILVDPAVPVGDQSTQWTPSAKMALGLLEMDLMMTFNSAPPSCLEKWK